MKSKMISYVGEFTQERCSLVYITFEFDFSKVTILTLVFLVNIVKHLVIKIFVR